MTTVALPASPSRGASHFGKEMGDAREQLERELLGQLGPSGHWTGELSASALSTATASFALLEVHRQRPGGLATDLQQLYLRGFDWLAANRNSDGGWGDTIRSISNLSTTTLCWAALVAGGEERHREAISGARTWIENKTGGLEPEVLKPAIEAVYGEDRTFSIPILTMCALAGCFGPRDEAFRGITALPFELAALPQSWFRFLGLPVVSYALPALIAVGQVQHRHLPTRLWPLKALRQRLRRPTLDRLLAIQPASGGFLEAAPLTSFVTMSLAAAGEPEHPVVDSAVSFLENSARDDGSWPIDENLATWVSTLSVGALAAGGELRALPTPAQDRLRTWLLDQQFRERHPFTGADPGGWAWTDLSGGVPDADDTPGALLALRHLKPSAGDDSRCREAAAAGITWLLDLQNRDGGIPTFCRGWGKLPFDRSSPDLTAHTLRAFVAWRADVPASLHPRLDLATERGCDYLRGQQRSDGSWIPLWFGNEADSSFENPVYGTSRVLRALEALHEAGHSALEAEADRATRWLLQGQNSDGGWGGAPGAPSSLEETALALDALAGQAIGAPEVDKILHQGARYLTDRVQAGAQQKPTPIGFYFANLWYFEQLYPLVFGVSALARLQRRFQRLAHA